MSESSDHNSNGGWLQVIPLLVILAFAITFWRPTPDLPPTPEQEMKIDDLAVLLGSPSSTAGDVDNRVRSFGPFPPDPTASRALAEALVTCKTASLDEPQRKRLARQLYGITVIGDSRAEAVPAAFLEIQRLVRETGCSPSTIDEIMRAARAVATTDPKPRRDWW